MRSPDTAMAARFAASGKMSAQPCFRAVFLLLAATLGPAHSLCAQAPAPAFLNWPSAITNVWGPAPVTFTNSTYPHGLAVSNVSAPVPVSVQSGTNGFTAHSPAGQKNFAGTNYVLLIFTPGTNGEITEPYTNTIQVTLSNIAGYPPDQWTSVSTNINIVITPPPADYPVFSTNFQTSWSAPPGLDPVNPTNVTGMHVAAPASNTPVLYPVPDITNTTTVYALFLSNSLGQSNNLTNKTIPNTNTTYLATSNGFGFVGPYTNVASPLHPDNPWSNANNLNAVVKPIGFFNTNNGGSAWVGLNFIPGTNSLPVTNYVQVLAFNGNNSTTRNWTTNNVAIVVEPVLAAPPALEVRFYNSSTNSPGDVYILPTSTAAAGAFGNGFWWTNAGVSNNYTNWITNGNATLRLSDIGVSGTNELGRPYYSVFTTNFPSSAWFLSYGGGNVSTAMLSSNGKPAAKTSATWYGFEWAPFEVTLDGNPADKSDMTYINEFSIPVTVRALTNDFASSAAGTYPTNSLVNLYQVCGFTNWTDLTAVAQTLSNMATQLGVNFPNAKITNASGKVVMYAGPSTAPAGTLVAPQIPPYTNGVTSNSFPPLTAYFAAVKNNSARTNKIKDSIGLGGAANSALGWGNTGTNPVYMFFYDFDLVVTASNTLLLTNGTITVSNKPGSTATNLSPTNYTGLWMEIGADAGVNDNWASAAVYGAPTPANYVTNTGANAAVQLYSTNASNGLSGQRVFNSSTNLWALIATNTATATDTNGVLYANPSVPQLYQSSFGTAVMGRILGDMAAGFALGFIDSDAINPATSQAYGDSPSGSWWGGNEYPQADTVNSNAYSDVNTNFSSWGNTIYSYATKVTYGHPIYDRMQFYGGGNPTSPLQIQPASATNNTGPGGQLLPVWVVEVEFFNGLSSIGDLPTPSYLSYSGWVGAWALSPAISGGTADPDGDGFDNNEEYAYGGNPTNPTPYLLSISGSNISYLGLTNATNYTVQNTTNLSTGPWTNYLVTPTNSSDQANIPLPAYYQRKQLTVPLTPGTNNFYRVIFSNQ